MANKVTVVVKGGTPKVLDGVSTVAEAMAQLQLDGNYSAVINGEPATADQSLSDYAFLSLAESVKGGR